MRAFLATTIRPCMFSLYCLSQNGGSCHDAEIHMVHVREGTDDDLLVVGVLLDASMYGYNNEVRARQPCVPYCRVYRSRLHLRT